MNTKDTNRFSGNNQYREVVQSPESDFRIQCDHLSREIMPRCGCIFELYQQRLSREIDQLIHTLPAEYREWAVRLARDEFDYLSPDEIGAQMRNFKAQGLCIHGLDPDCCPLGCGDI